MILTPLNPGFNGVEDIALRNVSLFGAAMSVDTKLFEAWLRRRGLDPRTIKDYVSYFEKLRVDCDVDGLRLAAFKARNGWEIKTLRHVVNLCWELGYLDLEDRLRLLEMLKVRQRSSPSYVVVDSVRIPRTGTSSIVYRLMLFSGARLDEVVKIVNEFDSKRLVCFEEFCRYGLFWYRGRKRCEWVYAPRWLWNEVSSNKARVSYRGISSLARKMNYTRPKMLRKLHYRLCLDVVKDRDLCDFYQSRSLSVGAKHYDLILKRADENYPTLMKVLEKILVMDLPSPY